MSADRVSFEDSIFKSIDGNAVGLLKWMLSFNADSRPTAQQVLRHKYITQRQALSKEPIEGLPAKLLQVSYIILLLTVRRPAHIAKLPSDKDSCTR